MGDLKDDRNSKPMESVSEDGPRDYPKGRPQVMDRTTAHDERHEQGTLLFNQDS
jgi:hypothetical protein